MMHNICQIYIHSYQLKQALLFQQATMLSKKFREAISSDSERHQGGMVMALYLKSSLSVGHSMGFQTEYIVK